MGEGRLSTIYQTVFNELSRELKRNLTYMHSKLGCWQYKPNYAQTYADERQKDKSKRVKWWFRNGSLFAGRL